MIAFAQCAIFPFLQAVIENVACDIYIYINKSTFFLLCGDDILGDVPSRGFEWRPCSSYYVCTYTFVNMTNLHKIGVYIYI